MRTHHPLANIAEWRKGCTCAPEDSPAKCIDCTVGLITAVENWFNERVECAKDQNRINSACHCTNRECGVVFGDLQDKCTSCGSPVATYVPLASQAGLKLADRLVVAICGDRQIEGFNVELLSQGALGPRLNALIVEMAGHEAEAYALQDQVEEANASIAALELRLAELTGKARNDEIDEKAAMEEWWRTTAVLRKSKSRIAQEAWTARAALSQPPCAHHFDFFGEAPRRTCGHCGIAEPVICGNHDQENDNLWVEQHGSSQPE